MTANIGDTRDGVATRLRRLVTGTFLLLMLVGISGVVAIEVATNQNSKLTNGYTPASNAHQEHPPCPQVRHPEWTRWKPASVC